MSANPAWLRGVWRADGKIDRGPFLVAGLLIFALKFALDWLISTQLFAQEWSPLDYLYASGWLRRQIATGPNAYAATMALIALPFLCGGVVLTLRRLRSAGHSPWLALLFFVPLVKFIFFLVLVTQREVEGDAPDDSAPLEPDWLRRWLPRTRGGSAVVAVLFTLIITIAAVALSTQVLRDYGFSLFLGLPFCMGFIATLLHGCHVRRSFAECMLVSLSAVALGGCALLGFALEGIVCLVMAAPLAAVMAILGAACGYIVQNRSHPQPTPAPLLCVATLAIPAFITLEHQAPHTAPLLRAVSTIEIDAPPERVWQHVVTFSELPPPTEAIFKTGVAYPIRAEITGHGPGAIRRCVFSTGAFVEPIEIWDEPRLLKFSVESNPAPMEEWTPYAAIHPPHLDGFFVSRSGQFRLIPLAGGRTLLEGTTWYQHRLWPAEYWEVFSDYLIHRIHRRVLQHVKALAEASPSAAG